MLSCAVMRVIHDKGVEPEKHAARVIHSPERTKARARVRQQQSRGREPDPEDKALLEETDLAVLVVKKTRAAIVAGEAVPTVKDGIAAQGILERRAERAADREFMLNLARALAGGGAEAPVGLLPDPTIIDGEVRDVTPVPPAEDDDTDLALAPAHLRA